MTTHALGPIGRFVEHHYRHFNAAALRDAARAYVAHIDSGKKMMVTLAGAMSSGELGLTLAEMIRAGKVHAITCTGANLEEDVYNLVAHDHYERIPNYRNLSDAEEEALLARHLNRVTDTAIPEQEAIRRIEHAIISKWKEAEGLNEGRLPHEFFYDLLREGTLAHHYQIDPKDSWLMAAAERDLPLFVPGWEDSTTGNIFAGRVIEGAVARSVMKGGIDYMLSLARWYQAACGDEGIGFFQVGGGIAGDFPICVVPMLEQDLGKTVPKWSYFCQISDSTTSYGSYSGAVPNEKITWGKLSSDTPRFIVESDATIVAPLVFSYVLGH
ncbi:MAG: deoxyhypusine synthase family protein [Ectothiorhodospiraceae bacterium]|nr:deoxyhypusine synthase family protein [Ectothiorhodospiraceae bacterium]